MDNSSLNGQIIELSRPKKDYLEENAEFKKEILSYREENSRLSSQVVELTRQIQELYAAAAGSESTTSNNNNNVPQDPASGGNGGGNEGNGVGRESSFSVDPTKEAFLSDMGFNHEKVYLALSKHNNNQEAALNELFSA